MIETVKLDQKFNQYKKNRESHIQECLEGLDQFSTDIIKCIKGQAENVENPVLISEFFKYIDLTTIQNKEIKFIKNDLIYNLKNLIGIFTYATFSYNMTHSYRIIFFSLV